MSAASAPRAAGRPVVLPSPRVPRDGRAEPGPPRPDHDRARRREEALARLDGVRSARRRRGSRDRRASALHLRTVMSA